MSLIVEGALEFEQRSSHPNPPTDGGVLLYVFEDGQLYAASSPVAGPGGSSRGGQPGQVWYDTNRAPLVFVDTVAAPGQLPNAGNVDVTNFVNNDLVVRLSDYELFQWQVSFISSNMVDLGVKWAGQIANGVPVGGTAGQILAKNSGTDFDTKWEAAPSGGGGSTVSNVASMNTGARAYRGTAFSMPASAISKIPVDTISNDPGSHFTTGNRYNVTAAGWYLAVGNVAPSASDTSIAALLYKNGVQAATGTSAAPGLDQNVSDLIYCNPGDYIELWGYNGSTSVMPLAVGVSNNFLSVVQVDVALQPSSGQASPGTGARAYRANALALAANGWTKVPMDTISSDPGGHFNTTTGQYVCPATGWYMASGEVQVHDAATGETVGAFISRNGAPASGAQGGDAFDENAPVGYQSPVVQSLMFCNAGDTIALYAYALASQGLNIGGDFTNWLGVVQVDQPIGGAGGNAVTPTTGARANRQGAYTLPGTGAQKIPLDTIDNDPGNRFTIASNRYVCPNTGWYQVNAQACGTETGNVNLTWVPTIYKNGTPAAQGDFVGWSAVDAIVSGTVSDLVYCNAGDFLELWVFTSVALPLSVGAGSVTNNWMSVVQVDQPTPVATNTGARAFRNAALSLTANTDFPIPVDTVTKDPGGHFSGGKYNVTAAGWYQVNGEVCVATGAPSVGNFTLTAEIAVSGAILAQGTFDGWTTAGGIAAATVSDLVYCNPGDTIGLVGFGSGAWALSVGTLHNYISVVKVDQPLYANNPSVVTALPATPFDGQEVYFVADAANGVKWHLRYNAGSSSTHKWEYLGGPNMISRVDTDETYTSTAGFTLAPTPDRLTFPLSGDYEYDFTVEPYQTSAATTTSVALSINGAAPLAPDFAQISSSGAAQTVTKPGNLVNMVAGQTVAMEYNNPTGGGVTHVRYRLLRIKPIRLG